MSFQFKPAVRENVPLLIGLAGGTGSGKTYSAMALAKGMAGAKPFAVIDTEAGRAKHYADVFQFDHGDLKPPFRPETYIGAIQAADKAGYPVIVVDSMSHEWSGDGGVLDWQEDELTRLAGNDYGKREAMKMAAWIKPKLGHKSMMGKLLQVRAHLILCFRAEPKIEMTKDRQTGKTVISEKVGAGGFKGWLPICEKNMPYELTVSFLLMAENPGIPIPMKLEAQHRPIFPTDRVITADSGARLAEWARGGATPVASSPPARTQQEVAAPVTASAGAPSDESAISKFWREVRAASITRDAVVAHLGHDRFEELDADQLTELKEQLMANRQPVLK